MRKQIMDGLNNVRSDIEWAIKPSREKSLVLTKVDEAILWLSRTETDEAAL